MVIRSYAKHDVVGDNAPENRDPTPRGEQPQHDHVDKSRQVFDFLIWTVVSLQQTQSQLFEESGEDVNSQGFREKRVVTERI